ncbi:MAG: YncE family protein, partial [Terriglobia bacterium]
MKQNKVQTLQAACLVLLLAFAVKLPAQQKGPLRLVATISLPGVEGKWDHFGADVERNRLFLASEDAALVEVFDLRSNKLVHTITGFKKPHAIFVRDDLNKIFVTDGEASEIKVFDGTSYQLIGHIGLTIDADPILYDPTTKYLWAVNGGREAHTPYCLVSVVDTTAGTKLADIKLNVNRLESMALERSGERLFVNMAASNEVGVLNR